MKSNCFSRFSVTLFAIALLNSLPAEVELNVEVAPRGPYPYYYGPSEGPYAPCPGLYFGEGQEGAGVYVGPGCPSYLYEGPYYWGPDYGYYGRRHHHRHGGDHHGGGRHHRGGHHGGGHHGGGRHH